MCSSNFIILYIFILRYQFPNGMISKICNLSTFFFTNHFINDLTNSVINSNHSEWWNEINYKKNWSNGDSVKISLVNQRLGGQLFEGWWVGELVVGGSKSWWSVGRRRTCWWVGSQWLVVIGSVEELSVSWWSVVGESVEHFLLGQWSVVGGRWVGEALAGGSAVSYWWAVGRCRTYRSFSGWLSVVGGSSVVSELVICHQE